MKARVRRKAVIFIILFVFTAVSAAKDKPPLSLSDIEALVKGRVSSKRIVRFIDERGVTIDGTDSALARLKALRASQSILRAIDRNAKSEMYVDSVPTGAEVFIDAIYRGKTPLRIHNIPPGKHELRVGKISGHEDYVAGILIEPGKPWKRSLALGRREASQALPDTKPPAAASGQQMLASTGEPLVTETTKTADRHMATVYVKTEPEGAAIYLDGEHKARSPAFILAPVGRHRLRIVRALYEEIEKDIFLQHDNGKMAVISVRLQPKIQ